MRVKGGEEVEGEEGRGRRLMPQWCYGLDLISRDLWAMRGRLACGKLWSCGVGPPYFCQCLSCFFSACFRSAMTSAGP